MGMPRNDSTNEITILGRNPGAFSALIHLARAMTEQIDGSASCRNKCEIFVECCILKGVIGAEFGIDVNDEEIFISPAKHVAGINLLHIITRSREKQLLVELLAVEVIRSPRHIVHNSVLDERISIQLVCSLPGVEEK